MSDQFQQLRLANGEQIAYHQCIGRGPGVVFLGGFKSDMQGSKAIALQKHCVAQGRSFLRFDYTGHGQSSGEFQNGTIGRWSNDARAVVTALCEGPQILVGSSMGVWIALLTAMAMPEKVAGLVGIAAAVDFTEDLIWSGLNADERERMMRDGAIEKPSEYEEQGVPITRALIEDGRSHLLLRGNIDMRCPVRLLHGMVDIDVPWNTSLRIVECLNSDDVNLTLVKHGDHRLSDPDNLELIMHTLDELIVNVS